VGLDYYFCSFTYVVNFESVSIMVMMRDYERHCQLDSTKDTTNRIY